MRAVAVIPARLASVRFPGKMLADRTGKPVVQHVFERARSASLVERVVVATDDERIAKAVRSFGGECVMTRSDHPNGTSRIAEAIETAYLDAEIVINVQGDEPEIEPGHIDLTAQTLMDHPDAQMATLAAPFAPGEDALNPSVVKVVRNRRGEAMYFSRSVIPFDRDGARLVLPLKHIGLYAYRRQFLARYASLPPSPLERCEQLEQLRVLEHGYSIAVALAPEPVLHHGIDTPEQYDAFVRRWTASEPAARSIGGAQAPLSE